MKKLAPLLLILPALLFSGCKSTVVMNAGPFSHFVGLKDFSGFTQDRNDAGNIVLLSPKIDSEIAYNQLVVSWNADAPAGTFVKIEAASSSAAGTRTKFYTMGEWSLDGKVFPRTSLKGQRDADGNVDTDTLKLNQPEDALQIRVTLGGTNGAMPTLKFIGLSFANTKVTPAIRPANHAAWGKIITTPEHSQHVPGASGWCSPTSTSMVLSRWADVMHRPEMDLTVPQVAASVFDQGYEGTGNWPFNTAFAGSFPGMRAYVTRLDDLSEVEDWIVAGIPVVLSTRWDQLLPGRPPDFAGHLVVCIGFTKDGDAVINDPATRLERGEKVQRIYKRENVINSWTQSHHAVYLVYPENTRIPENKYGHW